MRYQHRFRVGAPLAAVAAFHSQSASMARITPPPIIVRIHEAPPLLGEGDEMEFTLWLGPLPVRWRARMEQVSPAGFTDRQVRGPFAAWVHRHSFIAVDDHTTAVLDAIDLTISRRPLWALVGLGMWLGLPVLFAYRAWKTKRLLEQPRDRMAQAGPG
jgi:ligand-binding SRPBCC domain-containing protein